MFTVGIDVGGSHITTALINNSTHRVELKTLRTTRINPAITLQQFLNILTNNIYSTCQQIHGLISGIGIAMPGPFMYEKGVCNIFGVEKFDDFFGADFRYTLASHLQKNLHVEENKIRFINDAQAFLLGAVASEKLQQQTVIAITLGTGIGSAFYKNDCIITTGSEVPENGYLYNTTYKDGVAEDYISTRWFLKNYPEKNVAAIATLADGGDEKAIALFADFGKNLANVLLPFIKNFQPDVLVFGGGLVRSWHLIEPMFNNAIQKEKQSVKIILKEDTEEMNMTGAAKNVDGATTPHQRKTEQFILPQRKEAQEQDGYDIYPTHKITEGNIHQSLDRLIEQLPAGENIIIDGYGGVYWDELMAAFSQALKEKQQQATFFCVDAALKPADEIDAMIDPWLNSDGPQSIFGKSYDGTINDFFDAEHLQKIKPAGDGINILYGCGAALCHWTGTLVYVDIPKNEIQFRARGGSFKNLGTDTIIDAKAQYKRCYFIDWMVLNRHKQHLLTDIDFIVDGQQTDSYPFTTGAIFRNTLKHLSQHAFRVRPWFEPGVWGGHWMKENIKGLAQNVPNYAWSFELITPENGLILEDDLQLLEVSFDWLMFAHAKELLGKAYPVFGEYFPIRFDYLDTMDGDHLSVQCHPSLAYMKENFGEPITQDETYYILDCKEDAVVYLGFQEDINADTFKQALVHSQQTATTINIEQYVQKHPAKKHDLFLIPNQTIHGSGRNNMVLEISNTPYIFTFKLYDWVRLDMDGKPRPINIEHGMKNLDFTRKGDVVKNTLISKPLLIEEGNQFSRWSLPTHPEHLYTVERYEWEGSINIATKGQCHIIMLVEGHKISVTTGGETNSYHYAETVVIPASVEKYTIENLSKGKAMLVVAFVKDSVCDGGTVLKKNP